MRASALTIISKAPADTRRGASEIRVRGRVQGVGFRPTVWRIARDLQLDGEVLNDGGGVLIRVSGSAAAIAALVARLEREPPPLARIDRIERRPFAGRLPPGFRIAASEAGAPATEIAPDAALCPACAAELLTPAARRSRYAFTNCTQCGPRLAIVRGIPYDRSRTTMAAFRLCPACAAEYENPADRRFHAEAIACPACGPRLALARLPELMPCAGDPIVEAARLIEDGAIVAVKGIGGYQLACDATNAGAVAELRRRKRRDGKPFALMARDIAMIRRYCTLDGAEEAVLRSPAAPIVLLRADGRETLPASIAPGLDRLGFMLPTTPLHLLLLRDLDRPVVMTSGNLSDEPQATDDADMAQRLAGIADYALTHDRDIANRVDDSVVRVVRGQARLVRRARGYAPAPIMLPPGFDNAPEILALGGELKATFCLLKDGRAILSQHLGDLEHPAAFDDYKTNLALYRDLFVHRPMALAADRHPEYLSAKLARDRAAAEGLRLVEVQHHHAHIAACLAENGRPLAAAPVIGIALDGLGWGDDGTLWGGEVLLADYRGYTRLACLMPVAMPGGAAAAREPWRNLYAHLTRAADWPELEQRFAVLPIIKRLAAKPLATIDRMLARGINVPPASSTGRLFDAVAAALEICFDRQANEGDAAMRLEALAASPGAQSANPYTFAVYPSAAPQNSIMPGLAPGIPADGRDGPGHDALGLHVIDPAPMWEALLRDLARAVPPAAIAAGFHEGLAAAVATTAERLARRCGVDTIALSGGCLQNALLFAALADRLEAAGLTVLSHARLPANDGGLALGQAAVAAAQLIGG